MHTHVGRWLWCDCEISEVGNGDTVAHIAYARVISRPKHFSSLNGVVCMRPRLSFVVSGEVRRRQHVGLPDGGHAPFGQQCSRL
jgi:hypothetical protein